MYARSAEEITHATTDPLPFGGEVTPSEKAGLGVYGEVIYCRKFKVPYKTRKKVDPHYLVIYFPNVHHTNTGHGEDTLMYSEMARMFLRKDGSQKRWAKWFDGTIIANDHLQFIDDKIGYLFSAEVKNLRKEYMSIRKSSPFTAMVADSKSRIARTQRDIDKLVNRFNDLFGGFGKEISARTMSAPTMPRFRSLAPEGLSAFDQSLWAADKEREFSTLLTKFFNLSSSLRSKKSTLANATSPRATSLMSPTLRKIIEENSELTSLSGRRGLSRKQIAERLTQIEVAENPYLYGFTIEQALERIGKDAVDYIKDAFRGAKAPDIVEKTKRNRRSRRNPDEPPLYETGEFLESIEYVVI